MTTFIDILGYFIVYGFICVLLNTTQMTIRLAFNKLKLPKIKLPKSRKYTGKETPIYEVFKDHNSEYFIRKWKLDWRGDVNLISYFLFPILCEWVIWEYVDCGEYFLCDNASVLEEYTESQIEMTWETCYTEHLEEINKWAAEAKLKENHLNKLNEKFNRNWI